MYPDFRSLQLQAQINQLTGSSKQPKTQDAVLPVLAGSTAFTAICLIMTIYLY